MLAAYGVSLANGFAFDDYPVLVENPATHAFTSPWKLLTDPATHGTGDVTRAYRPFRTFLFQCQYAIWGDHAAGYHAVNLLLHLLVVVLVRRVARRFLAEPAATLAAAVFACHPLVSEVVVSVKAQDDLVAGICTLSCAGLFLALLEGERSWRPGNVALLLLIFIAGLTAKENVLALPLLLGALLAVESAGSKRPRTLSARPVGLLSGMAAISIAYYSLRSFALGSAAAGSPASPEAPWLFPSSIAHLPSYFKLFLWPADLTIDYSHLPRYEVGSAAFWVSLAAVAIAAVLLWRTRSAAVRFGVAWTAITLLPSLNLTASYFVFAERFAYLPLIGMILIVFGLFEIVGIRQPGRIMPRVPARTSPRTAILVMIPVLALLCWRSSVRARDWESNVTLAQSALRTNPDSSLMKNFLARSLLAEGRLDEARAILPEPGAAVRPPRSFRESAELVNRAILLLRQQEYDEAADLFRVVVSTDFAKWHDWLNYGTALTNVGDYGEARTALERARSLEPDHPAVYRMLGRVGIETSDYAFAAAMLGRAVALDPQNTQGWYYHVLAVWKSEGEEAARARVREAVDRGISLRESFLANRHEWEGASARLLDALESH